MGGMKAFGGIKHQIKMDAVLRLRVATLGKYKIVEEPHPTQTLQLPYDLITIIHLSLTRILKSTILIASR